jgi:hypothetical protein
MSVTPPGRIIDGSSDLTALNGATLRWWCLVVSLGEFRLLATGLPHGVAEIGLWGTSYMDCPVTMHGVRLRVATNQETEDLRRRLPSELSASLRQEDHLVVECDEGRGCIWAEALVVRWLDQPDAGRFRELSGPLWPGGPPLAEL